MNAGVGDNYEVKVYMYIHEMSNYKYCDDFKKIRLIYLPCVNVNIIIITTNCVSGITKGFGHCQIKWFFSP